MSQDLLYKVALSFIPQVGAVNARNLISYLGGIDKIFSSTKAQLEKVPGIGEKRSLQILKSDALKKAEEELLRIEKHKVEIIFYLDSNYPKRLNNFENSPLILYKKGNLELNPHRSVAIIGTRTPTEYGKAMCQKIVEDLKPFNVQIISGMAYGIDATAHRTAIYEQISTVGILGNGMTNIYPAMHHNIAKNMLSNGGILSEYPMLTKPDRENFPRRNRIIAALSDIIIVVESAEKGGSKITAEYANEYSKDVFAVPGKIGDKMSVGCNHLIKTHKAHMYTNIQDLIYITRWDQSAKSQQLSMLIDLTYDENNIYSLIKDNDKISLDTLILKCNLALSDLAAILLNLEFKGFIKSLPGKKYILTP